MSDVTHFGTSIRYFAWKEDGSLETDYWQSEHCRAGYACLVNHADTKRLCLLLPDQEIANVPDMLSAMDVVAYFGFHPDYQRNVWRIVFDDRSKSPYVLHTSNYLFGTSRDYEGWEFELLHPTRTWRRLPLKIRWQEILSQTW